jgi:hypothetical protein
MFAVFLLNLLNTVQLNFAARTPRQCRLRSVYPTRVARGRRAPGIPVNPVRAPLRQMRVWNALPHTKAIPSLKHSVLAYIPVSVPPIGGI